ncbi:MAG: hypothetical protein IIU99_04985 [Treponema sp.]|nr:hypothetical protein [Treponema sp.]
MIFRQKKIKKKEKLIENFNAIFFLVDFVPQNRSFRASLSGHPPRRRKLLLRWTAPQAFQSLPLVKVLRVYKIQRKTASNIKNRIKDFLPKTENQFSSCALSQEEVDLQEYHICVKNLVTL